MDVFWDGGKRIRMDLDLLFRILCLHTKHRTLLAMEDMILKSQVPSNFQGTGRMFCLYGPLGKGKYVCIGHTSKPALSKDQHHHLSILNLLLQDSLESDGVGGKFRNTLSKLLDRHDLLVEVEAEQRLVVDV